MESARGERVKTRQLSGDRYWSFRVGLLENDCSVDTRVATENDFGLRKEFRS